MDRTALRRRRPPGGHAGRLAPPRRSHLKLLAIYGPVLLAYCAFFYALAGLAYVAANPRLWVKGGFMIVELAPSYFTFAASELWRFR